MQAKKGFCSCLERALEIEIKRPHCTDVLPAETDPIVQIFNKTTMKALEGTEANMNHLLQTSLWLYFTSGSLLPGSSSHLHFLSIKVTQFCFWIWKQRLHFWAGMMSPWPWAQNCDWKSQNIGGSWSNQPFASTLKVCESIIYQVLVEYLCWFWFPQCSGFRPGAGFVLTLRSFPTPTQYWYWYWTSTTGTGTRAGFVLTLRPFPAPTQYWYWTSTTGTGTRAGFVLTLRPFPAHPVSRDWGITAFNSPERTALHRFTCASKIVYSAQYCLSLNIHIQLHSD